ncbi:PstS family phosphate ABC transporter substrate-binding protein [Pedobacter alpinus]|uniref:PstS family phosphate ABC transporter substrate-binding protein n=1 Tax=Pedobacter alpinus TaxID=1590643 RepID=A0ABW5TUQ2_9SPHI
MIQRNGTFIVLVLFFVQSILHSCGQQSNKEEHVTYGQGKLVADESLYPIVDDEYEIFANSYKRAEIKITYLPEKDIISQLMTDSNNVAIMSRLLSKSEAAHFEKKNIVIRNTKFAIDGIALITGKNNADSLITIDEIKAVFNGTSKRNLTFVFDNPKSSTVAYLMEITGVKDFPKNVYALKTNKEVIKYVNENPKAIGIVSVAWMKRPTPDIAKEVANLNFVAVKTVKGTYEKPTQSNLKVNNYPLIRDLYLINCQGKAGLGTGFAAFLASEIGQRIILKSGLAPDSLPSRQIKFRN